MSKVFAFEMFLCGKAGYIQLLAEGKRRLLNEILRRNPPDVRVTSGQKSSTKIIYIVL